MEAAMLDKCDRKWNSGAELRFCFFFFFNGGLNQLCTTPLYPPMKVRTMEWRAPREPGPKLSLLYRGRGRGQLGVLRDQLPEVSQLLQQLGEEEGVVGVIGQQVELQHLHDALLHPLDVHHVHQARAV
ncbi:hypothetical protein EYF80_051874 [Liparis tanakae]|uniref:Uncharacterized protein n=1 Tax=Liparis tanakae TaxID=230148 RepID=A0A4Z2FAJ8_9TELE|nr:hypothetical protein EYF80_051874 [Liparis tanakae]